jgi:hypothetical protein
VVAARPGATGGWELAVVRRGRLVAAGVSPPGEHPRRTIDTLLATAETVLPGPGPVPAATPEEAERILAWVERPETRLVRVESGGSAGWTSPARGPGGGGRCSCGPRRRSARGVSISRMGPDVQTVTGPLSPSHALCRWMPG